MIGFEDLEALAEMDTESAPENAGIRKEAERVAKVGPVGIFIYPNEGGHNTPHFHARFNDSEAAVFSIEPLEIMPGTVSTLRKSHYKAVLKWAQLPVGGAGAVMAAAQAGAEPPPTRLQALRTAWDQARAGGQIIHVASKGSMSANSGTSSETAEQAIA